MKVIFLLSFLIFNTHVRAEEIDPGYLTVEEQKFYKNNIMEGKNGRQRTDSIVREINKIYSQMESMKSEIESLKNEVEKLKKKQ